MADQLQTIVERMLAAGESEEDIGLVIRSYGIPAGESDPPARTLPSPGMSTAASDSQPEPSLLPPGVLSVVGQGMVHRAPTLVDRGIRAAGAGARGAGHATKMLGAMGGAGLGAGASAAATGNFVYGIPLGAAVGRSATKPLGNTLLRAGKAIRRITDIPLQPSTPPPSAPSPKARPSKPKAPVSTPTTSVPSMDTLPESWKPFAKEPPPLAPAKRKGRIPKTTSPVPASPPSMSRGMKLAQLGRRGLTRLLPGIGTALTVYDVASLIQNMDAAKVQQSMESSYGGPLVGHSGLFPIVQQPRSPQSEKIDPILRELLEREMSTRSGR